MTGQICISSLYWPTHFGARWAQRQVNIKRFLYTEKKGTTTPALLSKVFQETCTNKFWSHCSRLKQLGGKKRHLLFCKKTKVNHFNTTEGPRHSLARQNYGDKTNIRVWVTPPEHLISAWLWKIPTLSLLPPFEQWGLNKSHVLIFTDVANSWDQTRCLIDSHHMAPALHSRQELPLRAAEGCGRSGWRSPSSRTWELQAAKSLSFAHLPKPRSARPGLAPGGTEQTQKTHFLPRCCRSRVRTGHFSHASSKKKIFFSLICP